MFCPNCGTKVEEGFNFCMHCGFQFVSERELPVKEAVRNTVIRRIEGIRNRDVKAIESLVYKEKYMKFDDWPPFELQGLENEFEALKVLEDYNYETRDWKIEVFDESALAAFIMRYRGRMRDQSFNIQSRVSVFLVRREQEWKIIHEHWSRFLPVSTQREKGNGPILV